MGRRPSVLAAVVSLLLGGLCSGVAGCDNKPLEQRAKEMASENPGKLTKEESARVLAKVGNKTITLGEFAAALERLNEFDRMRYQSPERRRELLQEMIDLELLAQEAERRGLDKSPEVQESVRQLLRDIAIADARKNLPPPAQIPLEDVRGYYEAHRDEYREPERRRVSVITFTNKADAEKTLADAKKTTAMEWGKLVQKHTPNAPKPSAAQPIETLGDLGIVGPVDDPKGDNPRVPTPVRAAVFQIQGEVGSVLESVVEANGKFYLVRLAGKTPAHERSFAEAERSIRGLLLQQMAEKRERDLEEELKKQFPVSIDENALSRVAVPELNKDPSHASPTSSSSAH